MTLDDDSPGTYPLYLVAWIHDGIPWQIAKVSGCLSDCEKFIQTMRFPDHYRIFREVLP